MLNILACRSDLRSNSTPRTFSKQKLAVLRLGQQYFKVARVPRFEEFRGKTPVKAAQSAFLCKAKACVAR
jgi:hypothetical protein